MDIGFANRDSRDFREEDQRFGYGYQPPQGRPGTAPQYQPNYQGEGGSWAGGKNVAGVMEPTVIPMPGGGTFTLPPMTSEDRWTLHQMRREMFYKKSKINVD